MVDKPGEEIIRDAKGLVEDLVGGGLERADAVAMAVLLGASAMTDLRIATDLANDA